MAEINVRSHIEGMRPYEPIQPFEILSQRLGIPADQIVKLDANENPYGALPAVRQALAEIEYAHIYPDPESGALRAALTKHTGIPIENLLAGSGADELIDLLMRLILDPGDKILNCPPTFGMYAFDADVNDALVVNVPRKPDFSLDLPAVQQAVTAERPKMLFIASPNNPDGGLLSDREFAVLIKLPILLVLDEAYVDFAPPGCSRIMRTLDFPNLVVLRTFSKWAGLAGLRVGYGAFPTTLMPHLWKIKQPYNVSVAASAAALASLEHAAILQDNAQRIAAERERMREALEKISFLEPYPSQANFILSRVIGRDAAALKAQLAERGILVRYFKKKGLEDHIRISVGKPEHTRALLEGLE